MNEIKKIIVSYGGSVAGYVINKIMGEPHEAEQIQRVRNQAGNLPVIEVKRDLRLCASKQKSRRKVLKDVGNLFK